jgi:hypothetical protein
MNKMDDSVATFWRAGMYFDTFNRTHGDLFSRKNESELETASLVHPGQAYQINSDLDDAEQSWNEELIRWRSDGLA